MSLTFLSKAQYLMRMTPVTAICDLPERCNSGTQLKQRLSEKKYQRIDLRENALNDDDLSSLYDLTYLETLNLSNNDIKGTCLSKILKIPGLKHLNLAGNDLLDLNLATNALLKENPYSQLKTLNISSIQFDVFQLLAIINSAFRSARKNLDLLILGELKHLTNAQLELIYNTIQTLPSIHHQCVIIESSAIKQIEDYHLFNNMPDNPTIKSRSSF